MDPWIIGLIAVIVVGVAVIAYGAVSDRRKNARRAEEMLAPPNRVIPQFRPDAPAPHYLSDLQARREPEDATPTELSTLQRESLSREIRSDRVTTIDVGYASQAFVTDRSSSWAVLEAPRILICADPVESIRELLPVMERLVLSRTALIIVAPAFSREVLGTLEVNRIRRSMPLLALLSDTGDGEGGPAAQIGAATGAVPIGRSDLQASFVTPDQLGSCQRWVSDADHSFVIGRAE